MHGSRHELLFIFIQGGGGEGSDYTVVLRILVKEISRVDQLQLLRNLLFQGFNFFFDPIKTVSFVCNNAQKWYWRSSKKKTSTPIEYDKKSNSDFIYIQEPRMKSATKTQTYLLITEKLKKLRNDFTRRFQVAFSYVHTNTNHSWKNKHDNFSSRVIHNSPKYFQKFKSSSQ